MRRILSFILETAKIVVIALIIVAPIRYFIFQPFFVKGQSMEPNFENNDYLIVDELSYRLKSPQRGEVVVFRYPNDTSQRFIKRIIGLPGETIEIDNGVVIILNDGGREVLNESEYLSNTQTPGNLKISLDENEYFVLGDNRFASFDSRRWGLLPKGDIIGKVAIRSWPLAAISGFEVPTY